MKKRMIKIMLACLMIMSILFLTACEPPQTSKNKGETKNSSNSEATEIYESEAPQVSSRQEEELENTVTIPKTAKTTKKPIKEKKLVEKIKTREVPLNLTFVYPWRLTEDGPIYENTIKIKNQLINEYNIDYNEISITNSYNEAVLSSIVTNNPIGNVMLVQASSFADFLNKGAFAELNQAVADSGIDFNQPIYDQELIKMARVNGQQYAWATDGTIPNCIFYNKTHIKKAGLSDPMELYRNNKWDYDSFELYVKQLKEKNYKFEASSSLSIMNTLVTSNGGSIIKTENGKPKLDFIDSKTRKGLDYFEKWFVEDKIVTSPNDPWQQPYIDFINGDCTLLMSNNFVLQQMKNQGMNDEIGMVPFPKGPDVNDYVHTYSSGVFFYFIPKRYQNEANQILYLVKQRDLVSSQYKESDYKITYADVFADEESLKLHKDFTFGNIKSKYDLIEFSGVAWNYPSLFQFSLDISRGNATVDNAIDNYTNAVTNELETVWSGKVLG